MFGEVPIMNNQGIWLGIIVPEEEWSGIGDNGKAKSH